MVASAASGAWAFQAALFGAAALCAVSLLVGYRTRLATLLSWLLLVSLHHRNPLILTGADLVLRLLLFWSLFLPLDARWAVRPASVPREPSVCSPASAALLLQVALVYLFSVVFKLRGEEWLALSAIRDSLAVEGVATDWGRWLLHFPRLLSAAAAATLALEALAVVLPFLPWRRDAARLVAALALPGLHVLGVGLSMRLGLMPAVMTLVWVPFLPGVFWRRGVGEHWRASPAPQTARRLRPVHALVAAAFALILVDNAASVVRTRSNPVLPRLLRSSIEALGLSQEWKLWDRPIRNRYYVFAATLRDGSQVDLHTGRALDWDRPRRRSANNHWWN